MSATKYAQQFLAKCNGFDKVLNKVKILSAGGGSCAAELKIEHEQTNLLGCLHGGFSASLVDVISSCALLTNEDKEFANIPVHISLNYVKAATIGDEIVIDAKMMKAGKRLAFLDVEIKNKTTGYLVAKGSHTKYLMV